MGQGGDMNTVQTAPAFESEFTFGLLNCHTTLAQLFDHGLHVVGSGTFERYFAFRCHAGDCVGGGLNAVRDDFVLRAAEFFDSRDGERGRAESLDLCTDAVEKFTKVDHLWLARGMFDNGNALGQSSGQKMGGAGGDRPEQRGREILARERSM